MSKRQYRVGRAALMAPQGVGLMGAARLLPPNSPIPNDVFSGRKLAEHLKTGAIVEIEDAVEAPEDEQAVIETAPQDGFMDGPQIESSDTKLADLVEKQRIAKEEAEALGLTKDGKPIEEPVKEPETAPEAQETVLETDAEGKASGPVGEVMAEDGAAESAKVETKDEDSAKAEDDGPEELDPIDDDEVEDALNEDLG